MILVVLVISIAMLFAILSSFLPFSNAYGNIVQYTSAYYGAISAVERGSLAVRYAGAGFDGASGWKFDRSKEGGHYNTGHNSDAWLEHFVSYGNAGETSLYWEVNSKTTSIPKVGEGDVDPSFIDSSINSNSLNYNAMNYNSTVLIPLGRVGDIQPTAYYNGFGNYSVDSNFGGVRAHFRVNPYLYQKVYASCKVGGDTCAKLCTTSCPGNSADSMNRWTPIVDRVIKGRYREGSNEIEVSILPSDGSDVGSSYYVHEARDSVIRKNNIGQSSKDNTKGKYNNTDGEGADVIFAKNKHPLKVDMGTSSFSDNGRINQLNIISRKSEDLKRIEGGNFVDIIKHLENPQISFELINYLWSAGSGNSMAAHHLYPFLEYKIESLGGSFSDLFYTIKGEGRVGKYDVRLQIKKPTLDDTSLGNFTIIF